MEIIDENDVRESLNITKPFSVLGKQFDHAFNISSGNRLNRRTHGFLER
jgi:hypothetical protein